MAVHQDEATIDMPVIMVRRVGTSYQLYAKVRKMIIMRVRFEGEYIVWTPGMLACILDCFIHQIASLWGSVFYFHAS